MTQQGSVFRDGDYPLYERIGYRSELETLAFENLAQQDLQGCRRRLAGLVKGLNLQDWDGPAREVVDLLLDVLQKVNRRVHAALDDTEGYQANRLALIASFGPIDDPESARVRFVSELDRLLSLHERPRSSPHAMVRRAVSFINENYRKRISLSGVAQSLHVSPNYLSRVFRRETGMTLTAYIQRVRLSHATNMMREGGRRISEIAYRVGYQNYRDFYRNFVKYEHDSPRRVQGRLRPPRN